MINNDWSPVPKNFGTIEDVKYYCEDYIRKILYKNKISVDENSQVNVRAESLIKTLSFEDFSIMCSDTIESTSCLLLLKLASGKLLSKSEINHLCYAVPAYVEDSVLFVVRPNYPLEYATTQKVIYKEPEGNYKIKELNGLIYKSKPSEDRIRHYRLEEVMRLYDLKALLGPANDGRYTEIEMVGMILWLYLSDIENFYLDIFTKLVRNAKHGLHLRALLKPYSVSVKRWPGYWSRYLTNLEPYIEVETILGYIIVETITDDMLDDLDTALDITNMYYYLSADEFLEDINEIVKDWVNVETKPIKTINLDDFFISWDLWTTSGSASDIRVSLSDNNKKSRIHKSAIPMFITVDELYSGRLQPSRTSIKAETSKARLVFSSPTYDTLITSYLLFKYDTYVQSSNLDDFFSYSQFQSLNTSADIIDKLHGDYNVGSSDVEHNDWIQDVIFDCYIFIRLIEKVILPTDVPILLDLCSRSLFNWVFIPGIEYRSRHTTFVNKKGTHILSTGGLLTGQRRTTLYNGFNNRIGNDLARLMVKRTLNINPGFRNIFGGDDSIQIFNSHVLGALTFIAATSIFLTISPLKSFISTTSAEYFRVNYSGSKRQGYSNRIVHSIATNNPTSLQEIDIVLKCKSMYDTLQIHKRRSRSNKTDEVFNIYINRLGVSEQLLRIPTSAGGIGIGQPSDEIATPGIPRFTYSEIYTPKSSWFDSLISYLNPFSLDGIVDSYVKDMSKGVINRDAVHQQREYYLSAVDFWRGKVKFKDGSTNWVSAIKRLNTADSLIIRSMTSINFSKLMSSTLKDAVISWQLYTKDIVYSSESIRIIDKGNTRIISDIINRSEMKKVSDKINFLKDNNLVDFSMGIINRLPGKVLLDLVLSSINGNNTNCSVPTDMHFYNSIIQPYQQSSKLSYVAQSILSTLVTNMLYGETKTHYSQLLGW